MKDHEEIFIKNGKWRKSVKYITKTKKHKKISVQNCFKNDIQLNPLIKVKDTDNNQDIRMKIKNV